MLPKPDLVNTTIQLSPDIFTGFIVVPAPLTPRFVNCTVNFTVVNNTDSIPFIIPLDFPPVNWTIENNTDGTPFIILDLPVNFTVVDNTNGGTPFIIPSGYPWVIPLQVYYLES